MNLFLDTNVWIDILLGRKPFYYAAVTILSYAEEAKIKVTVSSLSMVNANFICCERAKMPLSIWKNKIESLKHIIEISSVNSDDIYNACDSAWSDYEDAVQHSCAKRADSDYIVTRNKNDFRMSDIIVITPEEAVDILSDL